MNSQTTNNPLPTKIITKKRQILSIYKQKSQTLKHQLTQSITSTSNIQTQIKTQLLTLQNQLTSTFNKLLQTKTKYLQVITQVKSHPDVLLDVKQISSYLKTQKEVLKKLTSQSSDEYKGQKDNNNMEDIEVMLAKTRYEKVLRKFKKILLQQQIKYIQSNILVKNNFIYNPATSISISPSEQKEINSKLALSLDQLQRLINLSTYGYVGGGSSSCKLNGEMDQGIKLEVLKRQEMRLKECQRLIGVEYDRAELFIRFVSDDICKLADNVPVYRGLEWYQHQQPSQKIQQEQEDVQTVGQHEKVDEKVEVKYRINDDDIDRILNFQEIKPLKISLTHPFDVVQEKLNQLRKKMKKIQKYL